MDITRMTVPVPKVINIVESLKYTGGSVLEEKPPRIQLKKLNKDLAPLMTTILRHEGRELKGEVFYDMITDLRKVLGLHINRMLVIQRTLTEFIRLRLDKVVCYRIALKFHAHKKLLDDNTYIDSWRPNAKGVWSPVHVIDTFKNKDNPKLLGISTLVLQGLPAGIIMSQWLSVKYIKHFLKEIGFPKYDKLHPQEVFNTMFTAFIDTDNNGAVSMVEFSVSGAQRKHNSELHKKRLDCPLKSPCFCTECPRGKDQCKYAVKRYSWQVKACANGHKGYFDPDIKSPYCIQCRLLKKGDKNG